MDRKNERGGVKVSGGGIGFPGLLTILFVGLKLGGVINWSWWWILSPLWISFGLFLSFLLVIFLLFIAAALFGTKKY